MAAASRNEQKALQMDQLKREMHTVNEHSRMLREAIARSGAAANFNRHSYQAKFGLVATPMRRFTPPKATKAKKATSKEGETLSDATEKAA